MIRCHFYRIRSLSVTYVLAAKYARLKYCLPALFSPLPTFAKTSQCTSLGREYFVRAFFATESLAKEEWNCKVEFENIEIIERIYEFSLFQTETTRENKSRESVNGLHFIVRYAENNTKNDIKWERAPLILHTVRFRMYSLDIGDTWYKIQKNEQMKCRRQECNAHLTPNYYIVDMHSEKLQIQFTCRFLEFITRQNQRRCVFSLVLMLNRNFSLSPGSSSLRAFRCLEARNFLKVIRYAHAHPFVYQSTDHVFGRFFLVISRSNIW